MNWESQPNQATAVRCAVAFRSSRRDSSRTCLRRTGSARPVRDVGRTAAFASREDLSAQAWAMADVFTSFNVGIALIAPLVAKPGITALSSQPKQDLSDDENRVRKIVSEGYRPIFLGAALFITSFRLEGREWAKPRTREAARRCIQGMK